MSGVAIDDCHGGRVSFNNITQTVHYVYDRHGSARADRPTGAVTDTYDGVYPDPVGDGFGNLIHSSTTNQP